MTVQRSDYGSERWGFESGRTGIKRAGITTRGAGVICLKMVRRSRRPADVCHHADQFDGSNLSQGLDVDRDDPARTDEDPAVAAAGEQRR